VIDLNTNKVVATVKVDRGPFAVAVNPNTGKVYVANSQSGLISVIDSRINAVVGKPITVGGGPEAIALDTKTNKGWQHWCKSDAKDCVDFMLSGHFPGALIYGKNVYRGTDGNYIKLPGMPPIPPRPSTLPDVSKGYCAPGMYLDQTLGVYHCHGAGKTHELVPANMTKQWYRAW
jgi:YVTN family beta-propeller protein